MKTQSGMLPLALVLLSIPAVAQDTLSHQGNVLMRRANLWMQYPMRFALYTDREGGDSIWAEAYDSVDIVDGTFNVDLGSVTPFPSRMAENTALFLGVSVNDADDPTGQIRALCARWAAHARDVRGRISTQPV